MEDECLWSRNANWIIVVCRCQSTRGFVAWHAVSALSMYTLSSVNKQAQILVAVNWSILHQRICSDGSASCVRLTQARNFCLSHLQSVSKARCLMLSNASGGRVSLIYVLRFGFKLAVLHVCGWVEALPLGKRDCNNKHRCIITVLEKIQYGMWIRLFYFMITV